MPSETALRTLLLAQSSVTALVGTYGVFVDDAQQVGLTSYVVIQPQSLDPRMLLDGTYGIQIVDVDIDCYSDTVPGSRAIADAVATYLKDLSTTSGSTTIHAVQWDGRGYDNVLAADGSSTHLFVTTDSYRIQWS